MWKLGKNLVTLLSEHDALFAGASLCCKGHKTRTKSPSVISSRLTVIRDTLCFKYWRLTTHYNREREDYKSLMISSTSCLMHLLHRNDREVTKQYVKHNTLITDTDTRIYVIIVRLRTDLGCSTELCCLTTLETSVWIWAWRTQSKNNFFGILIYSPLEISIWHEVRVLIASHSYFSTYEW